MTSPAGPSGTRDGGFLSPRPGGRPTDHCFRCGKETPAGTSLCEEHNPRHLRGPSSTQMHATVFVGIVVGVVGLLLLARLAVGTTGPFTTEVMAAATDATGAVTLTYSLTNEGASDAVADCRLTRDGVPRPDDLAFRSPLVVAGRTITLEREVTQAPHSLIAYVPASLSVICS